VSSGQNRQEGGGERGGVIATSEWVFYAQNGVVVEHSVIQTKKRVKGKRNQVDAIGGAKPSTLDV